jgi:phenylalanyl-tRNA synthetase beta chain
LTYNTFEVELAHVNRLLGINIHVEKAKECASKMGLTILSNEGDKLNVEFPPTRSDILHPCDIVEDIGIGYGFNNIAKVFPETNTVGSY